MVFSLSFIILLISFGSYAQSIKEICQLPGQSIERNKNLDHLQEEVCDLNALITPTAESTKLTQDVYDVINKLKADKEFKMGDGSEEEYPLTGSLKNLAQLLNKDLRPQVYNPRIKNEKTNAFKNLMAKFGKVEEREKNPALYQEELFKVVSSTKDGKRLIECFENKDTPEITLSTFEVLPNKDELAPQSNAEFDVRPLENGKFKKVLLLRMQSDPIKALSSVAHELQHSCMTKDMLKIKDREGEDWDLLRGLDEIRANLAATEMFKELALTDPKFFCDQYYVTGFFGKRIQKAGDFYKAIEEQIAEGVFSHTQIDHYSCSKYYDKKSFYEFNKEGSIKVDPNTQNPIFREKFKKMVEEAGFKLK